MLRIFLFTTLFLFSLASYAEETNPSPGPLRITITQPTLAVSAYVDYKGFTTRCDSFINSQGQLGRWGQALQAAIQRVGQDCFFNQADYSALCPNFSRFNNERKMQFLAFMFGTMAYDESSCTESGPLAEGQGPNGRADGLFQLEYSWELRQGSARDAQFCRTGGPTDTQDLTFQMECTASIFRDGFCRRNNRVGVDFWYWEELIGVNRHISRYARQFPYCGNGGS